MAIRTSFSGIFGGNFSVVIALTMLLACGDDTSDSNGSAGETNGDAASTDTGHTGGTDGSGDSHGTTGDGDSGSGDGAATADSRGGSVGGETGTSTGSDASTTGPVSLCDAYCNCMTEYCDGQQGNPYASQDDCLSACEGFADAELACYGMWCEQLVGASPTLTEHLCQHAWGEFGTDKC